MSLLPLRHLNNTKIHNPIVRHLIVFLRCKQLDNAVQVRIKFK